MLRRQIFGQSPLSVNHPDGVSGCVINGCSPVASVQVGLAYQRLCPECRAIDTSESEDSDDESYGDGEIFDIFNAAMQSEWDDLRRLPQGRAVDAVLKVSTMKFRAWSLPTCFHHDMTRSSILYTVYHFLAVWYTLSHLCRT